MSDVFIRVQLLAKEKNISIVELQKQLKIGKQAIFKWRTGTVPRADTLMKVADYFGVSIDFLMGRTNRREINGNNIPATESALTLFHKIESSHYNDIQAQIILNLINYAENFDARKDDH